MSERLSDVARYGHIQILRLEEALRHWSRRLRHDERGQTSTEYLMIVGIMAAVIVFALLVWFWPRIQSGVQSWSGDVERGVSAPDIPRR